MAMEGLIADGLFAGVFDFTLTEWHPNWLKHP